MFHRNTKALFIMDLLMDFKVGSTNKILDNRERTKVLCHQESCLIQVYNQMGLCLLRTYRHL